MLFLLLLEVSLFSFFNLSLSPVPPPSKKQQDRIMKHIALAVAVFLVMLATV